MYLGYEEDRNFTDRFEPLIRRICGEHLIVPATEAQDAKEATDLLCLDLSSVRIGCRVRTNQYWPTYKNEFTIRSGRPSGTDTEMDKVLAGWGDYIFYGFSNQENDGSGFVQWFIGDFHVLRRELARKGLDGNSRIRFFQKHNSDGTSFYVFDLGSMPDRFIVWKNTETDTEAYQGNGHRAALVD